MPDFESIYQQYFRFVWNSARRLGIGIDSIEDVVQEVFIVIHHKLPTLENPDALRSWIYGIVRRTSSTHRRKHKTAPEPLSLLGAADQPGDRGPGPLAQAERRAQVELLSEILSRMKESKREVFMLVELEQWTVPEVASALNVPLNTAYSRLRLAREEFEVALARSERGGKRGGPV